MKRLNTLTTDGSLYLDEKTKMATVVTQAETLLMREVARSDDPLGFRNPPPNVLNLLNGEFDLDTGVFRPHAPESYLRIALDVTYDANAKAPRFEEAVKDMFGGDLEMYRHMCEVMALIISPRKPFAAMVMFIGQGANGKSEILRILNRLLGLAGWPCEIGRLDYNNFSSAALVGKTAVIDDDLDHHKELPTAMLKKISELKQIRAEAKYGAQFDFVCEVTPVIATNGYPPARDMSQGFRRRVNVISFEQRYLLKSQIKDLFNDNPPPDVKEADPTLTAQLEAEASGILNILLEAMKRLKERGSFDEPQQVIDAREEWYALADSVRGFMAQSGQVAQSEKESGVKLTELHPLYARWCESNGLKSKSVRKFPDALRHMNLLVTQTNGANYLRYHEIVPVTLPAPE